MVYFSIAMALLAGEDYEEVAVALSETLRSWGCWWRFPGAVSISECACHAMVDAELGRYTGKGSGSRLWRASSTRG